MMKPVAARTDPLREVESMRETLRELARLSVQGAPAGENSQAGGTHQEVLAEVDVGGATYRFSRVRQRPHAISVTPRELEIAHLVAKGFPTKAIGSVLGISPWTVLTHLRRVYARLGVNSRAAMVARLSAEGLL